MGQTQEFLREKELIDIKKRTTPHGVQGGHLEAEPLSDSPPPQEHF